MKVRGIARQLGFAIGLVLLIMAAVGGISVWRLFVVKAKFEALSTKYVPQVEESSDLERATSETMYNMRGYSLSRDEAYLAVARTKLAEVKQQLADADALVEAFPDLVKLANVLPSAREGVAAYEKLVDETAAAHQGRGTDREKLDAAAATYMANCAEFLSSQHAAMTAELATELAHDKFLERLRKIELVTAVQSGGYDIRVMAFKALAADDPALLQRSLDLFPRVEALLDELQPITLKEENLKQIGEIRAALAEYKMELEGLRAASLAVSSQMQKRDEVGQEILDAAQTAADAGKTRMTEMAGKATTNLSITVWAVLAGAGIGILLGIIIAVVMAGRISRPLLDGAQVLAAAAAEVSTTVSQIAASAGETATAVAETGTSIDEVRQTAQLAKESAKGVSDGAQSAAHASQNGSDATRRSADGLRRIGEQMKAITGSVMSMSEKSLDIGDIITTVNDLAEQSNLLAVNASIEAARAGEQGKGFAVVAQEIRSLAAQSKDATKQVRTILNDVQKATGTAVLATEQGGKAVLEGQQLADQAAEAINSLAAAIAESAQAATQIAASSQQQLAGMEQVGSAMSNIKEASLQNQASTTQLATAARNLQDLGANLKQLVEG